MTAMTHALDLDVFRQALASFPSGVTLVTTTDADGEPWGFTASAFCSVSVDPPLVLVCLARSAQCHNAFTTAEGWTINVIHADQVDLAMRFATRGADKFAGNFFDHSAGHPALVDASVVLRCSRHAVYQEGDHTILIGEVREASTAASEPVVYFRRQFGQVQPLLAG